MCAAEDQCEQMATNFSDGLCFDTKVSGDGRSCESEAEASQQGRPGMGPHTTV